jgi:PIN domain nuclease of toxin-antitoxin system
LRLLLDTHIWLWSILTPERMGRRVRQELDKSSNEFWLSPLSIGEYFMLCRKGRIVIDQEPDAWLSRAMSVAPLKEAALTFDVAVESGAVQLPHPDPVDRFLVATARVFDLTLVTADQRLIEAKSCPIMANR